jgi:hypothetical protein
MLPATTNLQVEFTDQDLYGANGPLAEDVHQGQIGDCYLLATLAAVAHQQPEHIKKAITYDKNAKCFHVSMYKRSGKPVSLRVTSQDIVLLGREGGVIFKRDSQYVIWPAVIETAFALMHDSVAEDGLDDGVYSIRKGGYIEDAMMALVGFKGQALKLSRVERKNNLNYQQAINLLACRIDTALYQKKFVTLEARTEGFFKTYLLKEKSDSLIVASRLQRKLRPEQRGPLLPPDGLRNNHGYTVMAMDEVTPNNWFITLRNPWGHNLPQDGSEPLPHPNDPNSALIHLNFAKLLAAGGVGDFRVSDHR